ncbi:MULTISPECIES: SpoIIE family protein phosphatase [unclassified Methylobacterium]|uniref:SpoIIE family protein phosphatase n=1 Tax=unclassified Methylobacterium TaxID=2615210 RepID=UPI0006FE5AA3|nr:MULTISPECIES: SpoIIE family protein phosphatase [unclassified Methylobacterium]KQO51255.1 serine/threonine protein phosphatase [Methylobacterium sp. Leaf86]KQO98012.1 serine/threonine protein phosphatase [Methylobacterium sp. Leaf91]
MKIASSLRSFPGETACGDVVAWWRENDSTLIAVADGLGHGTSARLAAESFMAAVEDSSGLGLAERMQRADRAIVRTRGVAATLVQIDLAAMTLTVAGVGNIQGGIFGARTRRFDGAAGIVGAGIRAIRPLTFAFDPADVLVLWSDGLRHVDIDETCWRFRDEPQRLADCLLARFGCESDDCSVLCVAFDGAVV